MEKISPEELINWAEDEIGEIERRIGKKMGTRARDDLMFSFMRANVAADLLKEYNGVKNSKSATELRAKLKTLMTKMGLNNKS